MVPITRAADTIYTNGSTGGTVSGNWSTVTWTQSGTASSNTYPTTTDAGNVAQNNGTTNTTSTLALDVSPTIGALYVGVQQTTVANWTLNASGTNAFTMNGTGLSGGGGTGSSSDEAFAINNEAAIASRSGGTLTVNPNVVLASNLGVGTTSAQNGSLIINGNLTASTAASLTFRGSTLNANVNGTVTLNGSVGASGSNIALANLRSSASGTSGAVTLNGNLGPSVTTVTQNGVATMLLAGTNTYTGATTVTSGTLQIKNGAAIPDSSAVSMGGGTLSVAGGSKEGSGATVTGGTASGTSAVGLGALTLTANSTLDFDSATNGNALVFAGGSSLGSFKLSVTNWTNGNFNGTTASGLGTDDRLIFNQDMSANLGAFNFNGNGAGVGVSEIALGGGFYEVGFTAVPEPATWAGGALLLGVAGLGIRRRLRAC